MELKKYITYEEPLEGKSFTINQLHEVYRDLVDKEEYDSCDPLLGVPHFEDGYIAVVDGTGRVRASNVIDSDKYEKLDVTVLLKAPSDPNERQKFEAKKYEYQNSGTEPLKDYQKHGARLIREDRPTMLLEELKHQYDFDWVLKKGQREGGILGSYPYTRELCEKYGRSCMEYILDICKKSGFNRLSNGYSRCVFKALRDMWRYYASDRNKTEQFLSEYLHGKTPALIKARSKVAYEYLDADAAFSFYIEDAIVENLHLQQTRKLSDDEQKLEVIRKFA